MVKPTGWSNDDMTSKEKIINAAVKEFSAGGLQGARVERIAKVAGVNKAMIFYYFGSKEKLHKEIINKIAGELFEVIRKSGGFKEDLKPEMFFDIFPENYIRFLSEHNEYLKIIGINLIQNPEGLKGALQEVFNYKTMELPVNLRRVFSKWYKEGLIAEPEPMHLMLNIISLCIFPLIAKTIPEVIFNIDLENDKFIEERIVSVKNLLKRGVLK